jgi:hypothetical protein
MYICADVSANYKLQAGCMLCCCHCVQVVPVVASKKVEAGGFWVLRPDSGDPVEVVLQVSVVCACLGSM